jgi:hypothetical protein
MGDMNLKIVLGASCLGIIMGWLVYRTVLDQDKLSPTFTRSLVAIMFGAAPLGVLKLIAGHWSEGLPQEDYFYPVGLLFGVMATAAIKYVGENERKNEQRSDEALEAEKEIILQHISHKSFQMLSFDKLRSDLGKRDWDDDYIRRIIARYPTQLRNSVLKGGRPGVAIISPEDEG